MHALTKYTNMLLADSMSLQRIPYKWNISPIDVKGYWAGLQAD